MLKKLIAISSVDDLFFSSLYNTMPTPLCEPNEELRFPVSLEWVQMITLEQLQHWVGFCAKKLEAFPRDSKDWFKVQYKKMLVLKLAWENPVNRDWIDENMASFGLFDEASLCGGGAQKLVAAIGGGSRDRVEQNYNRPLGSGTFGCVYPGSLVIQDKRQNIAIKSIPLYGFPDLFLAFSEYMAFRILGCDSAENGSNLATCFGAFLVNTCPDKQAWILLEPYPQSLESYIKSFKRQHTDFLWQPFGDMDRVFLDIVKALKHIHSNNMAFLDLKDSNVLINHQLGAVLTDFGLTNFWDASFYPLFATDFSGMGGTIRPPFVFDVAGVSWDLDNMVMYEFDVKKQLNCTGRPCDLRNVDMFALGAVVAVYFTGKSLSVSDIGDKSKMEKWVKDIYDSLSSMLELPTLSVQQKFWASIAMDCLSVSFEEPISINEIFDLVCQQDVLVRHGTRLSLDGIIDTIERQAA